VARGAPAAGASPSTTGPPAVILHSDPAGKPLRGEECGNVLARCRRRPGLKTSTEPSTDDDLSEYIYGDVWLAPISFAAERLRVSQVAGLTHLRRCVNNGFDMSAARAAPPPPRPPPPRPNGTPAAAESPQPASSSTSASVPPTFSQLALTLTSAKLTSTGGARGLIRPNPYAEVIVDGKPGKRTETAKGTYSPRWSEVLTLLVTPYSKLLIRIYDRNAFKRDAVLAETTLDLFSVLKKNDGKLAGVQFPVELKPPAGSKMAAAGERKAGELSLTFDGMNVDVSTLVAPVAGVSVVPSAHNNGGVPNGGSPAEQNGATPRPPPRIGGGGGGGGHHQATPTTSSPQINGATPTSSSNSTPSASNGKNRRSKLPPLAAQDQSEEANRNPSPSTSSQQGRRRATSSGTLEPPSTSTG